MRHAKALQQPTRRGGGQAALSDNVSEGEDSEQGDGRYGDGRHGDGRHGEGSQGGSSDRRQSRLSRVSDKSHRSLSPRSILASLARRQAANAQMEHQTSIAQRFSISIRSSRQKFMGSQLEIVLSTVNVRESTLALVAIEGKFVISTFLRAKNHG
jgi:hypothetical protein